MRHGQVDSREIHRTHALFNRGAKIFWFNFKCKITPVHAERSERGVLCIAGDAECEIGKPKTAHRRVAALISG